MRALSALRKAFGLNKTSEVGKRFPPEELKRIVKAMCEYGASKCDEQKNICQKTFDDAYNEATDYTSQQLTELYMTEGLKECESPEFD